MFDKVFDKVIDCAMIVLVAMTVYCAASTLYQFHELKRGIASVSNN